ncbi:MAG TPA: cell envelope integrity protein CreD [Chryseosolibacter sp.]
MDNIQSQTQNILERFNNWIQESIMVKLFSIGFLILILLIPTAWIEDLIYERQQRADEVIDEVADKWSGSQKISGPVLVIPFKTEEVIDRGKEGKEIREKIAEAFFLPENLDISGDVRPEILHRGIFDAVVYQSSLKINATFAKPDLKSLPVPDYNVRWQDAYMVFGLTDLRGISDNPMFLSGNNELTAEPSNNIGVMTRKESAEARDTYSYDSRPTTPTLSSKGIVTKLNWQGPESFESNLSVKLNLKGSRRLDFVPAGKTTSVKLTGTWNNPSFDGEFLPASREVTENGFTASWKVLHFNRPFSQQWTGGNQELSGADFGVKLLIPVDQYQKSIRTSKYGVLIILLTFMALFLVEITQKIRIHPFQYILIGAALIIYYTLLLSFSEHIGYNIAYIIASLATVTLIGLYSTTFFTSSKLSILFTILLVIFYAFIYIIILQQDFSLLLGSIGLFLIVGTLMYFSRKVKWYKESLTLKAES